MKTFSTGGLFSPISRRQNRNCSNSYFPKFCLSFCLLFLPPLIANANPNEIEIGMSAAFKGATGGLGTELYRGSMSYTLAPEKARENAALTQASINT